MKKIGFLLLACLMFSTAFATDDVILLSQPDLTRLGSVMKALKDRKSTREFSAKMLSKADLSDLLWAANGVNRPESGKRTAPSAMNKQDVDIYAVMAEGTYRYDAENHRLVLVNGGDFRSLVAGGQKFVEEAPVSLVLVSDVSKFGGKSDRDVVMGAADAGIVSQNISLFCAAAGLATVPRGSMDHENLAKALKLSAGQQLMLNHPVGYPKQ